ncbi:MAG: hypothetical protein H7Z17_11465 [Fuerstia sp.]|nr:hypothetical protein [Fuerstiella sp.]
MSLLTRILNAVFLTTARLFLVAWIGGAALFVMTSIAEQRTQEFDSMDKDRLATIRFPLYYLFGATCLSTAIAATGLAIATTPRENHRKLIAGFSLCVLSASIAGYDYVAVYSPLQRAITPPGQVRGPDFLTLHEQSRFINEVHLSFALLAAILICLPARQALPRQSKDSA